MADAIEKHKAGSTIFIDVRDSSDIAKTGTISGALKIQRGLIEFAADEATGLYNEALKKDSELILVCGAGGQAALTGKTLVDMGIQMFLMSELLVIGKRTSVQWIINSLSALKSV